MKKILVVGYGSIGKRHVENLLSISNLEVIVCTKRNDVGKLKKHVKVYNTIKQCLNEKPDIGIIANETSLHIPTAIKLAKAGLDLFLEKPLSNSLKDVEKLRAIVKRKKLITQMGCNMRFHPCIKKIKNMIEQKKLEESFRHKFRIVLICQIITHGKIIEKDMQQEKIWEVVLF